MYMEDNTGNIHSDNPEEQAKNKAKERMEKLKDLSINLSALDPNDDFENVPAYIRRNMQISTEHSSAIRSNKGFREFDIPQTNRGGDFYENNYLSLYFSLSEYSSEEITEIISLLSDLYISVG